MVLANFVVVRVGQACCLGSRVRVWVRWAWYDLGSLFQATNVCKSPQCTQSAALPTQAEL